MSDLSALLKATANGDRKAAADLLPLVYDELRSLAAARMATEPLGITLAPTDLVHEAYLRLVAPQDARQWENNGHFFSAAAEAMRRILVEVARRKSRLRHGGRLRRIPLPAELPAGPNEFFHDLLSVDSVVDQLAAHDAVAAEVVKLRVFAGLTVKQTAAVLGLSVRTAHRNWSFARAWMFNRLESPPKG